MQYPNLHDLFGAYFHQDCFDDSPTATAVVELYVSESPNDEVRAAAQELRDLISRTGSEAELAATVADLGCYYLPTADRLTTRAWLDEVVRILDGKER
ncbi:hypothetical protein H7F36_00165 [Variovorax sp. PAMC28562]|uniref:contact-dependent growth inhibition system immunity protein n=1 Tax=Variovorax sp. PAMC28562 TaxID=2762323 RepID=UPI00164E8152|nr:contact-dependent growth inhibition system immunity protein [Variovorax sp. PAMC28562]QNK73736.1 hypothetical protein H7F36_00165 [Variovorax sp. PAMC28562]